MIVLTTMAIPILASPIAIHRTQEAGRVRSQLSTSRRFTTDGLDGMDGGKAESLPLFFFLPLLDLPLGGFSDVAESCMKLRAKEIQMA